MTTRGASLREAGDGESYLPLAIVGANVLVRWLVARRLEDAYLARRLLVAIEHPAEHRDEVDRLKTKYRRAITNGRAWRGHARHGLAWPGKARRGDPRHGREIHGPAGRGSAGQGSARQGKEKHQIQDEPARQAKAGQGQAMQGEARQGFNQGEYRNGSKSPQKPGG